jgi:hypothetical protein
VAINLFTDNVPTLAIQAPIVRQVPKIFCPIAISFMDEVKIKRIAGESEEKTFERNATLNRLRILEEGARICKQHARRTQACKFFETSLFALSS